MEFDIIAQYFQWQTTDKSIIQAVGDDCAIIQNPQKLIISTDTLVAGVHFFYDAQPKDIAYKALMVNLSDIAAMGGVPKYFTLNLTLPEVNNKWLQYFAQSLQDVAKKYNISLIGGDTTKGALSITITIIGEAETPILRSGARVGDGIFVSGVLGGAALALEQLQQHNTPTPASLKRLLRPTARLILGQELSTLATSCIDISDGLTQDLSHILHASQMGADLWSKEIPLFAGSTLEHALYGGDDYELCFTAPVDSVAHIDDITHIGMVNNSNFLTVDGTPLTPQGYQHF